ncbi:restriction endonuclease [Pedobacter hiemivivus]|uniref:Restriction endonuclease n=1 Tax=Pedobacter hiemivivus TaxID=2530454 RepID=A0A4U1GGC1_9SPHI|nr:restriction endonuclease [Pedobacter hiemivivus]TKC62149.1 restriction endonuclease [Pedobacter hiemivivus]
MKRMVRVFEHQILDKFSLCTDKEPLGVEAIDALWKFNDANGQKYFIGTRHGVRFKQFVGVLQVGNVTIEILPKADLNESEEYDRWQDILLKMLKYCKWISVDSLTTASLRIKNNSLLDLYFELYLKELESLIHQGLFKKYKPVEDNVTALKGSLRFSKHIQQNLVNKARFYTAHQVYSQDHLLHQILLYALQILKKINCNHQLTDRINRVLFSLPEISWRSITASHFKQIVESRKTKPYKQALQIAKMLILNYSPDIKQGKEDMIAILFDMNRLWEEFVYRVLSNNLDAERYRLSFQNKQDFWDNKTIRPDIYMEVLEDLKVVNGYIIDTKWKIVADHSPSDEDLRQIFAYNAHWDCENSLLLYPSSIPTHRHSTGKYHFLFNGKTHHCSLGFIGVNDGRGGVNIKFHNKVLDMLLTKSATDM